MNPKNIEVRFCTKCVISNLRPSSTVEFLKKSSSDHNSINLGNEGICDACLYHTIKEEKIDWESRENNLIKLCDKYRKGKGYDVIVPGSGGKDSAYTAHILKYKYGMNPLTVTWAPHLYTDIGRQNFENWIHVGGLDNILFTPNGRLHRYLTGLSFRNLLHPFQPFIIGQRIIGPKIAQKFGIELIMYGENQAEYGNKLSQNDTPLMESNFYSSTKDVQPIFGGIPLKQIISQTEFKFNDFEPYLPVPNAQSNSLEVHYLGYYLKWDPQECFYYAVEHTGFKPNSQRTQGSYSKYSSIDDKIDPFHYYTTLIKFGLGRATYDAAQEIRNGKITRDEGVELVKKYDLEFPDQYFEDFLEYINCDQNNFFDIIDKFRPNYLWKRIGDEWELKSAVWK
jgi:N-acetyl sugar amidotransferase